MGLCKGFHGGCRDPVASTGLPNPIKWWMGWKRREKVAEIKKKKLEWLIFFNLRRLMQLSIRSDKKKVSVPGRIEPRSCWLEWTSPEILGRGKQCLRDDVNPRIPVVNASEMTQINRKRNREIPSTCSHLHQRSHHWRSPPTSAAARAGPVTDQRKKLIFSRTVCCGGRAIPTNSAGAAALRIASPLFQASPTRLRAVSAGRGHHWSLNCGKGETGRLGRGGLSRGWKKGENHLDASGDRALKISSASRGSRTPSLPIHSRRR